MCGPNSFLLLLFIWIIPISPEEFLDQTCICHKSQQLEITKPLLTLKHYLVKPLNKYLKDMICTRNEINSFNLWTTWEFDCCPMYFNDGAKLMKITFGFLTFHYVVHPNSEQQTLNVWTKFIPFIVIHMNYLCLSRKVFGPKQSYTYQVL